MRPKAELGRLRSLFFVILPFFSVISASCTSYLKVQVSNHPVPANADKVAMSEENDKTKKNLSEFAFTVQNLTGVGAQFFDTRTSMFVSNNRVFQIGGDCIQGAKISGFLERKEYKSVDCSPQGQWEMPVPEVSVDGVYNLEMKMSVNSSDPEIRYFSWVRDTLPPKLAWKDTNLIEKKWSSTNDQEVLSGLCENFPDPWSDFAIITIKGETSHSIKCESGKWEWKTPLKEYPEGIPVVVQYSISQKDPAGNIGTLNAEWTRLANSNFLDTGDKIGPPVRISLSRSQMQFTAGESATVTFSVLDAFNRLVTTDNSTKINITPSGNGRVNQVLIGTGDGSYQGGIESISVAKGIAQVTVTNTKAELFTLKVENNSNLENPGLETFEVLHGAPHELSFFWQPSPVGNADHTLTEQPVVAVADAFGNRVIAISVLVTLQSYQDENCMSQVNGGLTALQNPVASENGFATFKEVAVRKVTATRLKAVANGLKSACSAAISITPGTEAGLAFKDQPQSQSWALGLDGVTVGVIDAYGNDILGATGNIQISMGVNPKLTVITAGTTSAPLTSGLATFTGIRFDQGGKGFKLLASKSGLNNALSEPFDITSGPLLIATVNGSYMTSHNNMAFVQDRYSAAVLIYDVSDINYPRYLSTISTYGSFSDHSSLHVKGTYAYIGHDTQGLSIWDIGDPSDPVNIGMINYQNGSIDVIEVVDSVLYIGSSGGGIAAFDISSKAQPTLLGTLATSSGVKSMSYYDNRLYLALGVNGIQIVDVTNPRSMVYLGSFITGGTANKALVDGSSLYVAAGNAGIFVLDVSNPSSISILGSIPIGNAEDIYRYNSVLWVLDSYWSWQLNIQGGIRSIDISSPSSMSVIGSVTPFYGNAENLTGIGSTVFFSAGWASWSLIDAVNPALMSLYPMGGAEYTYKNRVFGNRAYLFDGDNGVVGFDFTNPRHPKLLGSLANDNTWSTFDGSIDGNYFYVGSQGGGLYIADISLPNRMTQVGSNFNCDCMSTTASNGRVYSLDYDTASLKIIDVSDPLAPSLIGQSMTLAFDTYWYGIVPRGSAFWSSQVNYHNNIVTIALTQGSYQGVTLLDVSNPATISVLGTYNPGTAVEDVVVDGNYAYYSTAGRFQVLDISTPSSPTLVSDLDTPGTYSDFRIAKTGSKVVFAGDDEIYVVDVSIPTSPKLDVTITKPDVINCTESVSIVARTVLLSCSNGGFIMFPDIIPEAI